MYSVESTVMKLTTALVAALGLLASSAVALPTSSDGLVSRSEDSADLGAQGTVMNGFLAYKAPKSHKSHNPRGEDSADLGAQGTVMNGFLAYKAPKSHKSHNPRGEDSADLGAQGTVMNGFLAYKAPKAPKSHNPRGEDSADLGAQGTVMNGFLAYKAPKAPKSHNPRGEDSADLGAQGTVMNGFLAYKAPKSHKSHNPRGEGPFGEPLLDPNHRATKSRRAVETTAEVASEDAELFNITLCNQANHEGTCTTVPMQKNECQSFPILITTRSLYATPKTICWIFNNEECHMSGDINDLWIWRWGNTDDLYAADVGLTFIPRGWLCDNFDA
ncbi:hypothetical protein FKW77_003090 [Venturia effusa]|uniref:Apple domain-containing protein n=1 Tax=Venturia effusa TaxID=50376 RepID=A0A517LF44_9PEZI|nr:hypothetical protein FKW77_003090 [Venturia effusa]